MGLKHRPRPQSWRGARKRPSKLPAVGAILIGVRLRFDVAADSSPPPCGEGKGRPSWVGIEPSDTTVPHGATPHPLPPPQGGGESARLPFVNLTPMGATLVVAPFPAAMRPRRRSRHDAF